jgi:hypothetical protein
MVAIEESLLKIFEIHLVMFCRWLSGATKNKALDLSKNDGLLNVPSLGSTTTEDYVVIMKQPSTLLKRWSKLLL